jgi:hypothetical protein
MNMEENTEYHVSDETLNYHIDNILTYKKFLENILSEIKSDNYNKDMIKLLSRHIEKSLSEISNETTLFEYNKHDDNFIPSVKIVSVDSDTSDSNSDDESIEKKLEFYQAKMDLYSPHLLPKAEPNTVAFKKIYEEDNTNVEMIHYNPELVTEHKYFTDIRENKDSNQPTCDFKPKDQLAYKFLNDNLELDNYHYLKIFDLNRIDNYCNSVKIY